MFRGLKKTHFRNIWNVKLSLSQIGYRNYLLPYTKKSVWEYCSAFKGKMLLKNRDPLR